VRYIFSILFVIATLFASSQTITALKSALSKLSGDKELKNATISFYALDVDSNKVIASMKRNRTMVPASTMKLITTATALELMGPNKRFSTTVQYSGNIDSNCVLNGNIYIKGGGDPSLGSHRFKNHYGDFISKWSKEIIKLGIDSINGRVIGDASFFNEEMIPSTWIWADLGNYYGAGPSGLSVYENIYNIELNSGKKRGDSALIKCIVPYIPNLEIENHVKSMLIRKDQSYIFGAPYQDKRIIKGGIPVDKIDFKVRGSIPDPAYLVAFELSMSLRELGVKVGNTATTLRKLKNEDLILKEKRKKVKSTYSPKLISLIQQTNMYSINLYAEHLMNQIGIFKYGSGDTGSGTLATTNFWKENGVDVDGMYIYDGSGLSRFNAITSKQLVGILTHMYKSDNYKSFLNTLPVAGKSGTLRNVGKGTAASGRVKAKSGTMTRVKSYSGYVKTKNNRNIAFALIVNNYNCTTFQMKKKMEKIMIKLAEIKE
jgi:serine-type D-Ala-D-Ala carboxypeptidase/endopeptidase (penicillin-binding protein 4)